MVTGHAHPQNSALHADRPHPPVISNKGVLHFWPFAKYAVAFPRMSRSIFTRANSARNRLISICSTLTALLLAGPFSRPSRFALTQLYKVCSTTPRLRAAAAMIWPDSTIRTASCLNSSVYCARVAFVISVSLALLNHSARDTFCAGKVSLGLKASFSTATGVLTSLRLLFARQAKGKRKLVLSGYYVLPALFVANRGDRP